MFELCSHRLLARVTRGTTLKLLGNKSLTKFPADRGVLIRSEFNQPTLPGRFQSRGNLLSSPVFQLQDRLVWGGPRGARLTALENLRARLNKSWLALTSFFRFAGVVSFAGAFNVVSTKRYPSAFIKRCGQSSRSKLDRIDGAMGGKNAPAGAEFEQWDFLGRKELAKE